MLNSINTKKTAGFNFSFRELLNKAIQQLMHFGFHGADKEQNELNRKCLVATNFFSISICLTTIITVILFLTYAHDPAAAMAGLILAITSLLPVYINRNGLKLSAGLFYVFATNIMLLIICCWFSHNIKINNYFLMIAITCAYVFTNKEKKWIIISVSFSLILFLIESTSLKNCLPACNKIKDIDKTCIILLMSQTMIVLLHSWTFIAKNRAKENTLLINQQLLMEAQKKLLIQNDDLKTYSIAASHSMQTPLYIAIFFTKRIAESPDFINQPKQIKEDISMVQNSLNQIAQLVNGLFSYNKIINIENEISRFDMIQEINEIKTTIEPNYRHSQVIVSLPEYYVVTNKLLFSIIMQNLIDNGLKYNSSDMPTVKIEIFCESDHVTIFIKDNGIGIAKEYREKIFEPFTRITGSSNRYIGNGLGLSGARRATERIGGNLTCISSNEQGSVFKLDIPVMEE